MPDRSTRDELLSQAFVLLVDSLTDADDIAEILTRLVRAACELLPARNGAILLEDANGDLTVVVSSSQDAQLLELLQVHGEPGPCVDCVREGATVESTDLDADSERWPAFVKQALNQGYESVTAVPLRLDGRTIGALNLFRDDTGGLSQAEHRLAHSLAHVAVVCMTQLESATRSSILTDQLQRALDSRVVIEQAKGILAERHQLDLDAAFALLRGHARRHNLRLVDAAAAVTSGDAQISVETQREAAR
jgi:GAF domain-containing protein